MREWVEGMDSGYPLDCYDYKNTCGAQGRVTLPKRMNFWSSSKGGWGEVILNKKSCVADFGPLNRGGQRQFGTFLKIHPFW